MSDIIIIIIIITIISLYQGWYFASAVNWDKMRDATETRATGKSSTAVTIQTAIVTIYSVFTIKYTLT